MFDVLGTDFQKLGTVENPSSANYSIYWQEIGGITLIAAATPNNLSILQNDRYISVNDPKRRGVVNETVYIICNVSLNEEKAEITVNGKAAGYLLHGRAMKPLVLKNTRALTAVSAFANDNLRGLPMVCGTMGELPDTEIIRYPVDGGLVDENAEELMLYCGCGIRVWLDGDHFCYHADSGRDRTSLISVPVFGRGSGTARNPTIAIDTSEYCNVAKATLAFTDGHSESAAIGDVETDGVTRRELYCGEITQESGEEDNTFRGRAKREMKGLLAEHIKRVSVSADIDAEDLAAMYQLGDIIPVKIGGFLAPKRITGIVWLKDQLNDKAELKLGDPIRTIIADIKDKTKNVSRSVGGVSTKLANTDKKVKLIQEDYKSLIARVDGVVAGMDAYVLYAVFDEYKIAVTRQFATMAEADASLNLIVEQNKKDADESFDSITQAQANLQTKVDDAVAGMNSYVKRVQKKDADGNPVVDENGNPVWEDWSATADVFAKAEDVEAGLDACVKKVQKTDAQGNPMVDDEGNPVYDDVVRESQVTVYAKTEDVQAGLDLVAASTDFENIKKAGTTLYAQIPEKARAEIAAYAWEDTDGNTHTVAEIFADVIKLNGSADVLGSLSIKNGGLSVDKSITTENAVNGNSLYANGTGTQGIVSGRRLVGSELVIGGKEYEPKEITSTSGAVLALGYA